MKSHLSFETTIKYFLDLLPVENGRFETQITENLADISHLAHYFGIYYYIIAWLNHSLDDILPDHDRKRFAQDLILNKTRNAVLKKQIIQLSEVFNTAQIPHMFLKGAAGLVRNLYDMECRYLSDIDMLVPEDYIEKSKQLLLSQGYTPEWDEKILSTHHHIDPYYHPDYPGGVELHREPYGLSMLDRPALPGLWDDADTIRINHTDILVPSLTDHIWILMRSDVLQGAFIPQLKETVEISTILLNDTPADFELLTLRAQKELVPNLVTAYSFSCEKFFGLERFVRFEEKSLETWYSWSRKQHNLLFRNSSFEAPRQRYGAISFLTPRSISQKFRFISWLSRYEALKNTECYPAPLVVFQSWRIIKDIVLYAVYKLFF